MPYTKGVYFYLNSEFPTSICASIQETWDKYLLNQVKLKIPDKKPRFYQNLLRGLLNSERYLLDLSINADKFINRYLTQNFSSLSNQDETHIADYIQNQIRDLAQKQLSPQQKQRIKVDQVIKSLKQALPNYPYEQLIAIAQDIVLNNKDIKEVIKNLSPEGTNCLELLENLGIYQVYNVKTWDTKGKREKHLDTQKLELVHQDMEGSSWCVRFQDYFDSYSGGPIRLIKKAGKPFILISDEEVQDFKQTDFDAGRGFQFFDEDLWKLLIKYKPNILSHFNLGLNDLDLIQYLISLGAKPDSNILNMALGTGDASFINIVLDQGVKPDEHTLISALETKDPQIVNWAIDLGAKPNSLTLDVALETRDPELVQQAIDLGAKPDSVTLTIAIRTQNPQLVQQVIDLGAKPDINTLDVALSRGNLTIIQKVLDLGAKITDYSLDSAFIS